MIPEAIIEFLKTKRDMWKRGWLGKEWQGGQFFQEFDEMIEKIISSTEPKRKPSRKTPTSSQRPASKRPRSQKLRAL